jgi:O-antigen/teichoic acid export membrane protein
MVERALGLLLLPLLTRRLDSHEYGLWAQTAVVSSVLMPLVLFGLPAAIVKFFSASLTDAQRHRWMRRTLAATIGLFAVIALCAALAPAAVAVAAYADAAERRFVAILVTVLAADALFDLLVAYLRAAFRMRSIAGLLVARGALRLGFMWAALGVAGWPFWQAFALLAALQLAVVGSAFGLELRRLACAAAAAVDGKPPHAPAPVPHDPARTDFGWRDLLGFAAPLTLVALLTSVNGFTDRFVLTQTLGLQAVAVYAATASLVAITSVAYTVLGFTLFPVLSRAWARGDRVDAARLASEAMRVFLFLALPFSGWLASVADTLLPLLATRAYRVPGAMVLLMGLAATCFGLYQIVLYLLLLAGKGLLAAWLLLAAAALNLALNLLLVPRFGLTGAAGAATVSNALLAATAYLAARRHALARFPWAGLLRIAFGTGLALGALRLIGPWLPGGPGASLLLGLVACAALYAAADLAPGRSVLRALLQGRGPLRPTS